MTPVSPTVPVILREQITSAPAALRQGERVYISGANAINNDGVVEGLGDAVAQTHLAIDRLSQALAAVGGSLENLTKLTTCIVDRGYRTDVYGVIAERIPNARPVSTGLVVAALPRPELIVQIDAEAAIPEKPVRYTRPYTFESWHGQGFPWRGSMVVRSDAELFVRGQTGGSLDHDSPSDPRRGLNAAAAQAEVAMSNLKRLVDEAGAEFDDVAKLTVYLSDRAYQSRVLEIIGVHLNGLSPAVTCVVTTAFARPEIVLEIDALIWLREDGVSHQRLPLRGSHPAGAFPVADMVIAGDRIVLSGQNAWSENSAAQVRSSASEQAQEAMNRVENLLQQAGATLADVTKLNLFVTESDFLEVATKTILERFNNVLPPFTAVVLKGLATPELLVEVDITATKP